MRRVLWLVCITVLLSTMVVSAQDGESGVWHWAWHTETGAIAAYQPDGDGHTLLDSGFTTEHFGGWRIDDESALAVLTIDSHEPKLYRLTSDDLLPVTFPDPEQTMGDGVWNVVATSGQYAVLAVVARYPAGSAVVVNLETNSAVVLPQEILFTPHQSAISADGRYFRYVGRDPENDKTWTIREYKLDTDTERVVYTMEDEVFPVVTTDTYGQQWIHQRALATTTTINMSGETVESIEEVRMVRRFVGDHLFSFEALCTDDCELGWESLADGTTQTFSLPFEVDGVPTPLAQIDDDHLLVFMSDIFWLLGADGSAQQVGSWSPQMIVTPLDRLLSPDKRYLFGLRDPDERDYQVWDFETGEAVVISDPERDFVILQILYGANGFIVAENTRHFMYYRSSDEQLFDLGESGGLFYEVVNDDTLLYAHYRQDETLPRGIYRYDVDSGDFTLVVEAAQPLYIQPIRAEGE